MKRINTRIMLAATTVSLGFESAELDAAIPDEEQVDLIAESSVIDTEISQDLGDIERLQDQAEGLEDLIETASRVTNATENEFLLTDIAAELATSGTDVELTVIGDDAIDEEGNPSLEAYVGRSISTEDMKEMLTRFWEAVKEMVLAVWAKIKAFWTRITGQLPSVVRNAKRLEARATAVTGKAPSSAKVDITRQASVLMVDNKLPKSSGDINKMMADLKEVCDTVLDKQAKHALMYAKSITGVVKGFDTDKVSDAIIEINTASKPFFEEVVKGSPIKVASKGVTESSTKPLPGNSMIFTSYSRAKDSNNALDMSEQYRSLNSEMRQLHEGAAKIPESVEIKTISPSECMKLTKAIDAVCIIIKQYNEKYLSDLEKARIDLESATEAKNKALGDDLIPAISRYWKSVARCNASFAKLTSRPSTQLVSTSLAACRAITIVGNRSMGLYE